MPVTYSRKRYIAVCVGCDGLFDSVRADQITCSSACRVKAHRGGKMKSIRALADQFKIKPAGIQHSSAIQRLRPDLSDQIFAETMTNEEARPLVEAEYDKLLLAQVRARIPA
jgi:hypothetical protein